MSGKLSLLDNSSDSEVEFTINKNYANKYDNWRNLEELQKYRDLKKADDDSESSSESEEEVPEFDEEFFRALSLVKGKDPRIYDKSFELFTKKEVTKKPKAEKPKKTFMKDYERNLVLERGGKFSDEEDEEEPIDSEKVASNEQMENLNSFKNLVKDSDDEDEDPILQERIKTEKEADAEEADYVKWLKGEEKEVADDLKSDMSHLRKYWNDPKLDEGEKFLRDYILNKRYLEKDDSEIPTYAELTSGMLSDDEKMIEETEQFEHKYNFRFEEPDEEFIKRYPRTVGDSLRKTDNRRKQKREEKAERRRKEKEQRQEELKRLKALKRKEIEEKFMKLKEISGRDEINLDESDIESDFDPDKHDQKMKEMFDDEYYQVEEDQKPEFPFDEELDEENWNTWTREKSQNELKDDEEDSVEQTEEGGSQNETLTSYKDEFADEMIKASQRKKKGRKKSLFAKVISQAKPLYDPDGKSFDEYLDEYYKLDYEDVIGDLPVRYKYRKVIPNDFGLTVDEILAAEERELNRWCSVKKTCQYRNDDEELYDVQAFKKKAANPLVKKKFLPSVYADNDDGNSVKTENMYENNQFNKRKDSMRETHSQKESMNCDTSVAMVQDVSKDQDSVDINQRKKKSKKKKQKGNSDSLNSNEDENANDSNLNAMNFSLEPSTTMQIHDDELTLNQGSSDQAQGFKKKSKKKKRKEKLDILKVENELEHSSHENAAEICAANGEKSSYLDRPISDKSTKRKRKDSETDPVVDSDARNERLKECSSSPESKHVRISDSNDVNNGETSSNNVNEVPSKKKKKKKNRKNKNKTNSDGNNGHTDSNFTHTKKHKKFVSDDKRLGLSDERLAAYGINPKKFKNRIIYSEK